MTKGEKNQKGILDEADGGKSKERPLSSYDPSSYGTNDFENRDTQIELVDGAEFAGLRKWVNELNLIPPSQASRSPSFTARMANCSEEFYKLMQGVEGQCCFHVLHKTVPDRQELLALRRKCYEFQQSFAVTPQENDVLNEFMGMIEQMKGVKGRFLPLQSAKIVPPRKPSP